MILSLVECAKSLATGIVDQSAVNVLQLMSKVHVQCIIMHIDIH